MIKSSGIFLILLLLQGVSLGQKNDTRFDSLITAGVYQIYGIKFEEADSTFTLVKKLYPNHPAGYFFDAMIEWWRIVLDINEVLYDDEFIEKLNHVIEFCDNILEKEPDNVDALFFKGGALGFRGRLYAVRKSFLLAALDGKDALPLVYKAYELDSTNVDVQLGFGIYNYYAEVIPEEYPFVKPFMIFFPGGDREKGLEQLKMVAKKGRYAKIESTYFLVMLFYTYEKDYAQALYYDRLLRKLFPDNPVFHRYEGRIFVRQGDWQKSAQIFQNVYDKCLQGFPGYNKRTKREASYYVGNWYKIEGKLDSAKKYLSVCEKLSREIDVEKQTGFLANTLLYLGMIYDKQGNREKAIEKYKETLDVEEFHNSHELAERYLEKPYK